MLWHIIVKARKYVLHNKNNERHFGDNFFVNYVIFLTGKNIKLSQFIQRDKNKSQPAFIHIHGESIIFSILFCIEFWNVTWTNQIKVSTVLPM
jgi:hypothetical protein